MNNERIKIEKIDRNSELYPQRLKEIADPPDYLYCAGDISLLNRKAVAVVGSRKFTIYGKYVSQMIGRRLGESGLVVVSGLANGIDAFSHEGMLEGGGKGIAVLGCGHMTMNANKSHGLMKRLLDAGGLVISEYEPDFEARKWSYPRRNRIISGLSEAVCVVEANYNSGALITAHFGLEQGRTVYAVPGNINSQFSLGSNLLIRDGAIPLVIIDDVVRDLGMNPGDIDENQNQLGEDEKKIVDIVKQYNGISVDDISARLKQRPQTVSSVLTILEIKGIVRSHCGKYHISGQ